jgi:hypothetical protein
MLVDWERFGQPEIGLHSRSAHQNGLLLTAWVRLQICGHTGCTLPHQLHHARVKYNLHLVLILSTTEQQVAWLQITVDDGVGLPASMHKLMTSMTLSKTCAALAGTSYAKVAPKQHRASRSVPVMKVCQATCGIHSNLHSTTYGEHLRTAKGVCQRPAAHELSDKDEGLLLGASAKKLQANAE